jgi:alanyl-tRNA synthetase
VITIDFDGPIAPEALPQIEDAVNAAVWENLPINCFVPTEEALPRYPYRRKKDLAWPVRLVEIPGIDLCACCGTHLPYTGGLGLVKLFSCVKFHEGVRIEMACGGRALKILSDAYAQNRLVSQAFSATIQQTGLAAQRMNETLAAEKLRANTLQTTLMDRVAGDYVNQNNVLHFADGLDSAQVRSLAEKICAVCTGFCAVFAPREGGYSYCLAQPGGDLRQLCKEMNAALNGRGGGRNGFAQGSAQCGRADIEAFFGKE